MLYLSCFSVKEVQQLVSMFYGNCHCEAVKFKFLSEFEVIEEGMRCNCSICSRKGVILSNFVVNPEDLEIDDPVGFLNHYQFGTGVAKHYFCSKCGISPFVKTRLNPGCYRINLGCIDGVDSLSLKEIFYQGTEI